MINRFFIIGITLIQVCTSQFPGLGPPPPVMIPSTFPGMLPDQDLTDEKYQPGKCLTPNVTSNLLAFSRCVREIIDPISNDNGARQHSFQEIYELLSFRLFDQPPRVSFEQPRGCKKAEKTSNNNVYVRLVDLDGNINREKGRVQVSMDNRIWGSICDDSWDERDAEVICRQLGHNTNSRKPVALGAVKRDNIPSPFGLSAYLCTIMDTVDCTGRESNMGQCQWISNAPSRCDHYEAAAVDCNPSTDYGPLDTKWLRDIRSECIISHDRNRAYRDQRNIDVRLVDGKTRSGKAISGRVEVRSSRGRWGSVCDDDFDDTDAMVICRQLGSLSEDRRRKPRAYIMGGYGSMRDEECITLDDLHCIGNENNVGQCPNSGDMGNNCQHSEDAAVDCNTFPYDVKLESVVQRSDYTIGVLMVSNDDGGTYGAVTDCFTFPTWNENATRVARKRLRNVPNRDCKAVWVTPECLEEFDPANPPEPLLHKVVCNSTDPEDLGFCEFQPSLAAFTTCRSTLAVGLICSNSEIRIPSSCTKVGDPLMLPYRQRQLPLQLPNNTFAPFGAAFGMPPQMEPFGNDVEQQSNSMSNQRLNNYQQPQFNLYPRGVNPNQPQFGQGFNQFG